VPYDREDNLGPPVVLVDSGSDDGTIMTHGHALPQSRFCTNHSYPGVIIKSFTLHEKS